MSCNQSKDHARHDAGQPGGQVNSSGAHYASFQEFCDFFYPEDIIVVQGHTTEEYANIVKETCTEHRKIHTA